MKADLLKFNFIKTFDCSFRRLSNFFQRFINLVEHIINFIEFCFEVDLLYLVSGEISISFLDVYRNFYYVFSWPIYRRLSAQ